MYDFTTGPVLRQYSLLELGYWRSNGNTNGAILMAVSDDNLGPLLVASIRAVPKIRSAQHSDKYERVAVDVH